MIEHRDLVIGDTFEQVAVVGDDDKRSWPRVEQILNSGERIGVEVIGGLVEEQNVRFANEEA